MSKRLAGDRSPGGGIALPGDPPLSVHSEPPCLEVAHRFALAVAILAVGLAPLAAAAQTVGGLTELLQPGSRPSIALGGDPFLSAIEDEDGWWPRLGLSRRSGVMVEGRRSEPLPSGAASFQETFAGRWAGRWVAEPRIAGDRVRIGGEIAAPSWGIRWAGDQGAVRLGGSGVRGTFGFRVRELVPGLTFQGVSPAFGGPERVRGSAGGVGVRYTVRTHAVFQTSWEANRAPEIARSDLFGEQIEASLNLRSERARFDGAVMLPGRMRVEGSVARGDFRSLEAREVAPVYHLAPLGRSRLAQASIGWRAPIGWNVLGRWTRRTLAMRGAASWGGQRFAELSSARAGQESYLLALEHWSRGGSRWLLDAEIVRADARARLSVESWPFTSMAVDLLGLRRIFLAQGEASWHRVHAGLERPIFRTARARLGLAWYDIAPRGALESWRPLFLVFGSTDRQRDPLGTRRLQLGALSLGCDIAAGQSQFELAVQQFVFARPFAIATTPGATEAPVPSAGAGPSAEPRPGWKGIDVRASVSRTLGAPPR